MYVTVVLTGFAYGLVSVAGMTLFEFYFWRVLGMEGVLEWHENQVMAASILRREPEEMLIPGLILHFLHGGSFGALLLLVVSYIAPRLPPYGLGVLLGGVLWFIALLLHEPMTGTHPLHLGIFPVLISFGGHLAYGGSLGLLILLFP
jgi:hypothetical protein